MNARDDKRTPGWLRASVIAVAIGGVALAAAPRGASGQAATQPSDAETTAPPAEPGVLMPPAAPAPTPPPARATAAPTEAPPARATSRPSSLPHGVTEQGGGLVLNFQDASIDVVLEELSAAAGFIVVKEVRPEGRVTLVSRQPISPADAVSLLNTVLRNAGYAAIQQDRILKIVARDQAKRLNIPVHVGNDPLKIANTDELITQVIPLRNAEATQLKTDIAPLINPDADFASNASSNALVITDTSANVKRVVEIVAALDTSMAGSVGVKVVQLKYAKASDAATLINNVFGQLDTSRPQGDAGSNGNSGGGRGGRGGGGGAFGGGGFGGGGFGGGGGGNPFQRFFTAQGNQGGTRNGKITAGSDDRTNSLVITGPSDTLEEVASVVKDLDANPAAESTTYVYRLRNAQAVNLETVLNALFNGTALPQRTVTSNADLLRQARGTLSSVSNTSSSSSVTGSRSTGNRGTVSTGNSFGGGGVSGRLSSSAQQAASSLAGQVTIIADTDTNSLIIRTSPTNYDDVKKVLTELDRPAAQVLIKVLVAEVTHDKSDDIGAEISVLNLRAGGNGQSGGTNFNIPKTGATSTGLVVQILETNFTAAIRALETAGKIDVLSRPYILASDNQLASITVGQEVPLITGSTLTDNGILQNQIQYQDVGILLDVIAHINPDGLVILDVAPEISALSTSTVQVSNDINAPVIDKRSALSRVGVKSGQTIVIGGLMEDRVTDTINKVPLLGDIPIVGALFQRHQSEKTKTELLIFLTPHVAADPELLQGMSNDEVKGTRLVPKAVVPGTFDEHIEGMQRGEPGTGATTQPGPLDRKESP